MNIFIVACLCFIFGCFCGITIPSLNIFMFGIAFVFVFAIKLLIFDIKTRDNLCVFVLMVIFFTGSLYGAWYDNKTFSEIETKYGTNIDVKVS